MRAICNSIATAAVFCVAVVLTNPEARGQITFRKIADTATAIPSGTGNFAGFGGGGFNQPSIADSNVAFLGTGSGGQAGIYADKGAGLVRIADTTTTIPAVGGTFTAFTFPVISGANVSYSATGSGDFRGVYLDAGAGPAVVADTTTIVPGHGGTFTSFLGAQDLSGANVILPGIKQTDPSQSGIYANLGAGLVVVADRTTPIPAGTGSFTLVVDPSISGTNVAFNGFGSAGQRGIYANTGAGLVAIADRTTAIPGGTGTFDALSFPQLSGTNLIFRGNDVGSTQTGIYGNFGAGLVVVADENTLIPGSATTFEVLGLASISGANVAFTAGFGGGSEIGLYARYNGSILKILDSTEMLDGKAFGAGQDGINLGINAFSGEEIVFEAVFADASRGVYVVTIPEPATIVLCALACPLAVAVRRRRRVSP
jgi:hypothetical protein